MHSRRGWTSASRSDRLVPRVGSSTTSFTMQTVGTLQVLDLSNVIAGPTIGAMFSRMGADVIKIDPPCPTYAPDIAVVYGTVVNMGKRSILLDVNSQYGRNVLNTLIRRSDLIIVNSTEQCLHRIHLTADEVRSVNPDAVLLRFDARGGPLEGRGLSKHAGYDDNVQAGIGVMERFGGGLLEAEEHAHIGTIDVIAGGGGCDCNECTVEEKTGRGRGPRTIIPRGSRAIHSVSTHVARADRDRRERERVHGIPRAAPHL